MTYNNIITKVQECFEKTHYLSNVETIRDAFDEMTNTTVEFTALSDSNCLDFDVRVKEKIEVKNDQVENDINFATY